MMKKWFLAGLLLGMAGVCAFAQTMVTLDEAIRNSAEDMSGKLPRGTKIAVLNFTSSSKQMAAYVIDEINDALVKNGKLTVVDRQNLALIRKEITFNDSEEVNNRSAQQIGRMLGAQLIINGSLAPAGNNYRFRIQALEVETAAIKYSDSFNIQNSQMVQGLMASGSAATQSGDFTGGQRAGAVVLNLLLFGTGSFIQKDFFGGIIIAGTELLGLVVMASAESYDVALAGQLLLTGGAIFGIVRPLIYHKPGYLMAAANQFPVNVALVPVRKDDIGLRLSYTYSY